MLSFQGSSATPSVLVLLLVAGASTSCQRQSSPPAAPRPVMAPSGQVSRVAAPLVAPSSARPAAAGGTDGSAGSTAREGRVVVQVTEQGFVPDQIPAVVGRPVTLAITRKTDKTCAREILFKGKAGKTDLPLDREVEVTYTPQVSGKVSFGCAMGMMVGGALEVRPDPSEGAPPKPKRPSN